MAESSASSTATSSHQDVQDGRRLQLDKIETGPAPASPNALDLVQSHVSHHDMPVTSVGHEDTDAEQYRRFSPTRKIVIVAVLSYCSFLAPIGSTSVLSAIPEVASSYATTGSIINASNALYLTFMGVAAPFWGPFSQVWGRRPVSVASASDHVMEPARPQISDYSSRSSSAAPSSSSSSA